MKINASILLTLVIISILNGCTNINNKSTLNNEVSTSNTNIEDFNEELDENKSKDSSKQLENKLVEYEMINKIYTKDNIKIIYPQIKNLNDSIKLNSINKDLEDEALNVLNAYLENDTDIDNLTMDITYSLKLKNNKYISIVYTGYSNLAGTAYPYSVFYTTNIDLEKGSSIRLSDYGDIKDISNKLKDSNNVKVICEDKKLGDAQKATFSNMDNSKLSDILAEADFFKSNGKVQPPKDGVYSYMDGDNIVVSFEMSHVLGDHAEFLVNK